LQDEINTKVVALIIRTGSQSVRLTSHVLKEAMKKFIEQTQHHRNEQSGIRHGKQTVGQLMRQNTGLTNLEITDQNIKSFERIARKYNIDFALQKDKDSPTPKYLVFFKARDVDVMKTAFKEYFSLQMGNEQKPSVQKKLEIMRDRLIGQRHHEKVKEKERGMQR